MHATMHGKTVALALSLAALLTVLPGSAAHAQPKKPNILVIWGDEIDWYNVSASNMGDDGDDRTAKGDPR